MSGDEFEDVTEFLAPDLVLPIGGKKFCVPPPPAREGLRLQALWALGLLAHSGESADSINTKAKQLLGDQADEEDVDFIADALGSAHQEMLDAGVPLPMLRHAALTAMVNVVHGKETAKDFWHSPGKAQAPPTKTTGTTSNSTGGANTTKKPGSGSGTKSRPKSSTG